jgi:hypothetical protein
MPVLSTTAVTSTSSLFSAAFFCYFFPTLNCHPLRASFTASAAKPDRMPGPSRHPAVLIRRSRQWRGAGPHRAGDYQRGPPIHQQTLGRQINARAKQFVPYQLGVMAVRFLHARHHAGYGDRAWTVKIAVVLHPSTIAPPPPTPLIQGSSTPSAKVVAIQRRRSRRRPPGPPRRLRLIFAIARRRYRP